MTPRFSQTAHVASACLALLLFAALTHAQGAHTLQGKVTLPDGNAPPYSVKITLNYNGRYVYETFTDLSGRFTFSSLRRGRYELIANGDEATTETTKTIAEVSAFGNAPQTFTQNIQLRLKKPDASQPAGTISAEEFDENISEDARRKYRKAIKDAKEDKPSQAIKNLNEAIALAPDFYLAHVVLGEQLDKLKQYEQAAQSYQKAIALKPDRAAAHFGLGASLVKWKKYDEARAPLRRSLELQETSAASHLFLGLAEMMMNNFNDAERHLLRAYELDKPSIAHIYLANIYEQQGEPRKAIEHLQAYLKENPNTPNAHQLNGAIDKLRKRINATIKSNE